MNANSSYKVMYDIVEQTKDGTIFIPDDFGTYGTPDAVRSLKQDTEGRFELNIDGVSHVRWFKRKKNEFMEVLGMPTKKQNRDIKL